MSQSSVPIVCTLHPNEWGGRLDEWHRLFATHLGGIERPTPTRLRLTLAADAGLERMRDLAAREMACCAFMTFTVTLAVHDPVVAGPQSQRARHSLERLDASWPRFLGECVDQCADAAPSLGIEPGELSSGGRQQADVVGHRATGRTPL